MARLCAFTGKNKSTVSRAIQQLRASHFVESMVVRQDVRRERLGTAKTRVTEPAGYDGHLRSLSRQSRFLRRERRLASEGAASERAKAFLDRLRLPVLHLQFQRLLAPEAIPVSNRAHRQISVAIMAQDGDLAESRMRQHSRIATAEIDAAPDDLFG